VWYHQAALVVLLFWGIPGEPQSRWLSRHGIQQWCKPSCSLLGTIFQVPAVTLSRKLALPFLASVTSSLTRFRRGFGRRLGKAAGFVDEQSSSGHT
jgi:hypothetical protein